MKKALFYTVGWLGTLFGLMVVLPLSAVIQAVITPIEVAIYCIANRTFNLAGYYENFAKDAIASYSKWLES